MADRGLGTASGTIGSRGEVIVVTALAALIVILVPHGHPPAIGRWALMLAAAVLTVIAARRGLALAFYQAFAWSALVRLEPAPVDVMWLTLAIVTLLRPEFRRRAKAEFASPVALLLLAVAGLGLLAVPRAPSLGTALSFQATTVYLILIAVWAAACFRRPDLRRAAVFGWLAAAVIEGSVSLAASFLRTPWADDFIYAQRLLGTFKDPNVFGSFVALPLLLVLFAVAQAGADRPGEAGGPEVAGPGPRGPNAAPLALSGPRAAPLALGGPHAAGMDGLPPAMVRWASPVVVILVAAAIGIFSRGTYLGLAVGGLVSLVVWAVHYRPPRLPISRQVVTVLIVAPLIGLALIVAAGNGALFGQRFGLQGYDRGRWAHQAEGLGHLLGQSLAPASALRGGTAGEVDWLDRLVGLGPGQYEATFRVAAHSTYLRLAVETGPLSLLLFLAAFAVLTRRALARAARAPGPVNLAVVGFLAFVLTYGFFIDTLHWRHLWMALALAMAPPAGQEGELTRP